MEINIARQLAFSFVAACGVFAMHFTGMSAATWYSSAAPTNEPGYPPSLSMIIIAFVIFTCLMTT
jgi:NO-binding membrane sensor protein with MHYT domain